MRMIGIGNGDCDPAYDEVEHYCPECNSIMEESWTGLKCIECGNIESDADEPDEPLHLDEP